MKKLTLAEFYSMDDNSRRMLRRKAFGHPAPLPPYAEGVFDLQHLHDLLVRENEETGTFPQKWTETHDDAEELAEGVVLDTVDVFNLGGVQ